MSEKEKALVSASLDDVTLADSDGTQLGGPTDQSFAVTESPVPARPFGQALYKVASENNRGLSSPVALNMTAAAYRQLEEECFRLRQNLEKTDQRLDEEKERHSSTRSELAVLRSQKQGSVVAKSATAILGVLSPILVGLAFVAENERVYTALIALAVIVAIAAAIIPFLGGGKQNGSF